jgi:hypothetical protein
MSSLRLRRPSCWPNAGLRKRTKHQPVSMPVWGTDLALRVCVISEAIGTTKRGFWSSEVDWGLPGSPVIIPTWKVFAF